MSRLACVCAETLLAFGMVACQKQPGHERAAPVASDATSKPSASSSNEISLDDPASRMLRQRAVEAVIWGLPIVNFDLMYQAFKQTKGDWNQVVYWSRPSDWKNQTLTPNPDTIYLMAFINTKDGPVVLEIPPANGGSITGSIDDAWQTAVEDVGPAGVDKGKGGKYLILPPGYKDNVPAGYFAMPSVTYGNFALLRSNLASSNAGDIAKAVAYGKQVKVYALAQAANPLPTTFIDVSDAVYDSTIPYDQRFFEALDRSVQREPWLERDKAMIDAIKSIGIEKGKPFNPDQSTQRVIAGAAREAHEWLDIQYGKNFAPPYNEGIHWALPANKEVLAGLQTNYANPDSYPVDGRAVAYSMGFFSPKHPGEGQFYLMTIVDKDGKPFQGSDTYRLTVPPNAPVKLYWSATAYDRDTHALIRDTKWSSRSSLSQGLQKNPDGSVDVYFAPKAPAGKESNWIPTNADRNFEVLFRLYGPEKPLFDKTWKLPDIEKQI